MVISFVQDECCKPYPPGSLPISNLAGFFVGRVWTLWVGFANKAA